MSRNIPTDSNTGNSASNANLQLQQQQQLLQQSAEGYNQLFGSDNRSGNRGGASLSGYNNATNPGGGGISGSVYTDQQSAAAQRRFTLSAASVSDGSHTQQVPIHGGSSAGGSDLLGNNSQRSHHSQQQQQQQLHGGGGSIGGYRGDIRALDSPNNLNAMNHGYPYGADLSPTHLAHRMSLGYYPMSAGSATSPNYGTLGDPMDLSGRGLSSISVPPFSGGALTQADREEELLLNLLIARRQRGKVGDGKGRTQVSLEDDLMRLRQSRSAANLPGHRRPGGGTIPQIPGIPPLYTETMPSSGAIVPPNMYPTMDNYGRSSSSGKNSDHAFPTQFQMRQIQDASERIDRNPGHFQMSDARMSEMREFSERSIGFKRSMGSMGMGMSGMMVPSSSGMSGMGGMGGYSMDKNSDYHFGGMDMREPSQPSFKKKRTHKKKPIDMPRRPLSAYNLFFSEERERILKEIAKKEGKSDSSVIEEGDKEPLSSDEIDPVKTDDDEEKPKALLRPLIPAEKKRRPHRKTHGKISFQELARMVGERWKSLPDNERKYYQDLAQEDMKRQKIAMEEYYAKQNTTTASSSGSHATSDAVNIKTEDSVAPVEAASLE